MELGNVQGETKRREQEKRKELIMPFIWIVLAIILQGIVANVNQVEGAAGAIINGLFFLLIPFSIYVFIKKVKEYNQLKTSFFNKPDLRNTILLYKLNDEEVAINYYNVNDYLLSFKWNDISTVQLVETEYMSYYRDTGDDVRGTAERNKEKQLKKVFDEIRQLYPPFSVEAKVVYPEKQSLIVNMRNGRNNVLPIPKSWEGTNQAAEFIRTFREKAGSGFIEPDKGADEDEDLIEYVVDFFQRGFGKKPKPKGNDDDHNHVN